MPSPKDGLSDNDFAKLFEELGAAKLSRRLNISQRAVYSRRTNTEQRIRRQLVTPTIGKGETRIGSAYPGRIEMECQNGIILIASDCHYWPGPPSTAHRAFVKFCRDLKPAAVIMNGDVIDACSISRHPPLGWSRIPTVQEEIEAAQERLGEIEKAAFKTRKIWTMGNHDARYEARLANVAPEFARVHGYSLKDHFPTFEPCWAVHVNNDVVVKHRWKGGTHATHNNAVQSGKTVITGHLHSAKVTPWDDYNGTRYGVDTGCIADPYHPAFAYMEDNPRNWRSAFAVLTFIGGRLAQPELALVWDADHVEFRGELVKC